MEENKDLEQQTVETAKVEKETDAGAKSHTRTAEDQLAEMRVEMAKLKRALDKSSAETSSYKKQLKERMTQDEVAATEKAEREAEREEQFQKLLKENTVNKYAKNFMAIGYPEEVAMKAATAQFENDTDTLFSIQKNFMADHDTALKAEWQKTIPELNSGVGSNGEVDPFLKGFGM